VSGYTFGFEKLDVYQMGKSFVKDIYALTKRFPDVEKYGLVSQINRSAVSVVSNLVEGNSRNTPKDKAHFTQLSYSSLMEVLCQIDISRELEYITIDDYNKVRLQVEDLAKRLNGLRKRQLGG
jgi:four helix bundle protein